MTPEQSVTNSLSAILTDLTESLSATSHALSTAFYQNKERESNKNNDGGSGNDFLPPANGISLLDLKNELMLSYLHNIVFLVLIKLRGGSLAASTTEASARDNSDSNDRENAIGSEVVKKLVELRVLLEKGVKPIESKLKYQIDKVVRAALEDEVEKKAMEESVIKRKKRIDKQTNSEASDESNEGEEGSDDEDSSDGDSESEGNSGKEGQEDDISVDDELSSIKPKLSKSKSFDPTSATKEELSYRPNPLALVKPKPAIAEVDTDGKSASGEAAASAKPGIYRPPRISATLMPEFLTTAAQSLEDKRVRDRSKPLRSSALDDFIASELSNAPMAEPSIGSTIAAYGRIHKTAREKALEEEKREYEENNFVRLPKLSKKERARERKLGTRTAKDNFGGEDWRSFTGDLDRIITKVESSASKKSRSMTALENSRKRKEVDGGGGEAGDIAGIGGKYNKLVKNMKKRRKR